jgi:uncharacterized protein YjdB
MSIYIKKQFIKTILVIFFLLLVPNSLAAEVIISAPIAMSQIGQTFNININIDPMNIPVSGAQLNIKYNQSVLKINTVVEGNFFKQEGAKTYFHSGVMNNSTGLIVNIFSVIIGPKNVSRSGTFLIINATAIGSSNISWINLSNAKISDPNGISAPLKLINGTINISKTVNKTLNSTISESPDPILSNATSNVTVHVTSNGLPVDGATVYASVTGGSLVSSGGLTDNNGDFNTIYKTPNVITSMTYTISTEVSKTGFIAGSGTDQITINPVPQAPFLKSINVTPNPLSLDVGSNQIFTASPKDQFNAPYPASVTWSSSNLTVGTVNSVTGKFTALSPGTAMVNATNGSVTGTAFVTINSESPVFIISNIAAASGKTYVQDTLAVGSLFYSDRNYRFTSIPISYIGLNYIKTATDDRYQKVSNFLQFDVNKGVTVYVVYDDRISPKASWLTSFTDTGDNVVRDRYTTFSIYARDYPAGYISFGGTSIPLDGAGGSYVVIVKPQ